MHILIVDDEPHIRFAIDAMLSKRGHWVIGKGTGREALAALQEHPSINLVICDLHLPDIEGQKLVEVIRKTYPHLRILATSVFDSLLWEACQRGADEKLVKPFGRQEFLSTLGTLMQGARTYTSPG